MDQTDHARSTSATPLLQLSTLVVKQKAKVIELKNEYEVLDETGQLAGRVTQVRQSALAVLARFVSSLDVALPAHLEVTDAAGRVVLLMEKP